MLATILALLVTTAADAKTLPLPDPPPTPGQNGLASVAVCAGSCLANGIGLYGGLVGGAGLAGVVIGPVLGLVGATTGGAIAEAYTADGPKAQDEQVGWGAISAAIGYLVGGSLSALIGYQLGATTSSDAPLIGGGFAALGFGAIGGAVGSGVGTFIALSVEPPSLE
jgi:hypothetical protein